MMSEIQFQPKYDDDRCSEYEQYLYDQNDQQFDIIDQDNMFMKASDILHTEYQPFLMYKRLQEQIKLYVGQKKVCLVCVLIFIPVCHAALQYIYHPA